MVKKFGIIVSVLMVLSIMSGCVKDDKETVGSPISEDSILFAKGLSDLSFSSTSFDELGAYVEQHRSLVSDIAFEDRLDFSDVAVMNMFKDEGAVNDYEVVETFVEEDLSGGTANVVVVSKVNYLYIPFDDHAHDEDDPHDHSTSIIPRTVVDIYRFKDNVVVDFDRL